MVRRGAARASEDQPNGGDSSVALLGNGGRGGSVSVSRWAPDSAKIHNMVLLDGLKLASCSVALGCAAAAALAGTLRAHLLEVRAHDVPTFILASALLCLVAVLAVWIPARRAVDPAHAWRASCNLATGLPRIRQPSTRCRRIPGSVAAVA